jgi:hypothetical protein
MILAELIATARRWLLLPDPGPLLVVLATVAANRLDGDPVWVMLVGPPGSGKTELLGAVGGLPDVHPVGTMTEASLLSGTPKRELADDAKGGLLRVIGERGLVVCKDFGSVLNMNRDARGSVLAALREIFDGSWVRHVGTDGGRTLAWQGRVGLLAGCPPTIDRHHAVMSSMGERFVLYRMPTLDPSEQGRRALAHAGREATMRRELHEAVGVFFEGDLHPPLPLSRVDENRLVSLATLAARCRSAVERDGYRRDVELVPEPEVPTRLSVGLSRVLGGLDAIGVVREEAWRVLTKVALDSIPAPRRAALNALLACTCPVGTGDLAAAIGYPTTTARRILEDLAAHSVVERYPGGKGETDNWSLTEMAHMLYRAATTVPEMSSNMVTERGKSRSADVSGTVELHVVGAIADRPLLDPRVTSFATLKPPAAADVDHVDRSRAEVQP